MHSLDTADAAGRGVSQRGSRESVRGPRSSTNFRRRAMRFAHKVAMLAIGAGIAAPAHAQAAPAPVQLNIGPKAQLEPTPGGARVLVSIRIKCDPQFSESTTESSHVSN